MNASVECPVCGAAVNPETNICEQCSFNLAGQTEAFDPMELSGGDVSLVASSSGVPQLTLTKGPSKGEVFYLDKFPVTLGRETSCDIFLNNRTVSRQHAIIDSVEGRIIVRDNRSLNGTWVNGSVVDEAELNDGYLLQIGTFSMRFSC